MEGVDENRKTEIIQVIQGITGKNKKKSTAFIDVMKADYTPVIARGVSKKCADEIKSRLESCGGIVAIVEK